MRSPAIITCLPLEIAPIAFSVQTCEASSNMTTSNLYESASRKRLTESGDIIRHGFSLTSRLGMAINNFLIGMILRCLVNSFVSILISSVPFVICTTEGKSEISLPLIRAFAI